MAIINILGIPHAYEITAPALQSSAPVLIFIHGWLLSRNYWQPLIDQLVPDYQCLTYDLRGFGDSQQVEVSKTENSPSDIKSTNIDEVIDYQGNSSYTLAAYAKDLTILLEALEINQAWLIGHSLGGSIAIWGAKYCSEKVQGVICLNAGGGIYLKEEFERFRSAGQQLIKRRPRWLSSVPLLDLLFSRLMVERPLARQWAHQRVVDFVKADYEAALGSLLDSTTEAEVHLLPQVISSLNQPVYFIAGAKDKVMEPKYVRHLASFHQLFEMNGNNVIEIPNCGHFSMLEQSDIVGTKIAHILQQHS